MFLVAVVEEEEDLVVLLVLPVLRVPPTAMFHEVDPLAVELHQQAVDRVER